MFEKAPKRSTTEAFRSFASADQLNYVDPGEGVHACTGCVAPCCSAVTLHEMRLRTFREVDYLKYVLGFERIELGWDSEGVIEINYRALCSQLDPATSECRVHDTPEQPLQCQEYDAAKCEYRSQYLGTEMPGTLRISRARFTDVQKLFKYDSRGNIVHFPDHEEVRACLDESLQSETREEIGEAEKTHYDPEREWPTDVQEASPADERDHRSMANWPCDGCSAWCCRVLLFPLPAPDSTKSLSFFRYLTLFPGLALAANPRGFLVQCFTSCTHLDEGNRCSLFGLEDRPVHCQTYDPWSCRYVPTFAQNDPRFRSISKESWPGIEDLFLFDKDGVLSTHPTFEEICDVIE